MLFLREHDLTSGTRFLVKTYIVELYCLVEYYKYSNLKDEIIWDRLYVGIFNKKKSVQLQMDHALT